MLKLIQLLLTLCLAVAPRCFAEFSVVPPFGGNAVAKTGRDTLGDRLIRSKRDTAGSDEGDDENDDEYDPNAKKTKSTCSKLTNRFETFEELRRSKLFVDKTMLLEKLFDQGSGSKNNTQKTGVYIMAPPLFGKTLNLRMIESFLKLQRDKKGKIVENPAANYTGVFKGTQIRGQSKFFETHFGQYIVITLDFNRFDKVYNAKSYEFAVCSIFAEAAFQVDMAEGIVHGKDMTRKKREVKRFYSAQCKAEYDDMEVFLVDKFVSVAKVLEKPIVLLLDGFDTFLHLLLKRDHSDLSSSYQELESFVKTLVKCPAVNVTIAFGALSVGDLVNNLEPFYFNENPGLAQFFGFLKEDVPRLLKDVGLTSLVAEAEKFYNGYEVSDSDVRLFNPYSIATCVLKKKVGLYWRPRASLRSFRAFFASPLIGRNIARSLFAQKVALPPYHESRVSYDTVLEMSVKLQENYPVFTLLHQNVFMSYLLQSGYYTPDGTSGSKSMRLANLETTHLIQSSLVASEFYAKYFQYSSDVSLAVVTSFRDLSNAESSYVQLAKTIHEMYLPKSGDISDKRVDLLGNFYSLFRGTHGKAIGVLEVLREEQRTLPAAKVTGSKMPGDIFGKADLEVRISRPLGEVGIAIEFELKDAEKALGKLKEYNLNEMFQSSNKTVPEEVILLGIKVTKRASCSISYRYRDGSEGKVQYPPKEEGCEGSSKAASNGATVC